MFTIGLAIAALASRALASPAPALTPRQNASQVTFHVTGFYAFMADPFIDENQSNMTFHVVDTRPEYYAEVDCVVPPTYFNLYAISALYNDCGDRKLGLGFDYSFNENYLVVRRGWKVDKYVNLQFWGRSMF